MMKEDMHIARSTDREILKKAENGGVVTSLLKFALESETVDAVIAIRARNGDRFDGVPELITDSGELVDTAGSLHCTSPNIARFIKEYLNGAQSLKIAVVVRPCDARGIIELAKRNKINMNNVIMIGVNCTGTMAPVKAKKMMLEEFEVNPDDVVSEDIEEDKLTIKLKDGTEKEVNLIKLEEKGYGRRDNCRRCDVNIPVMADIACGKWGTTDKDSTFIEIFSQKGRELFQDAVKAGIITAKKPTKKAIESREIKDNKAIEKAQHYQDEDFKVLEDMSSSERFDYWFDRFDKCIKCYGCRDACPICYCDTGHCTLEPGKGTVITGEVPPEALFPMVRVTHVMDSCVNCGQCQDVCPVELPLSRLIFLLSKRIGAVLKYEPGMDKDKPPPLRTATEQELSISGVEFDL